MSEGLRFRLEIDGTTALDDVVTTGATDPLVVFERHAETALEALRAGRAVRAIVTDPDQPGVVLWSRRAVLIDGDLQLTLPPDGTVGPDVIMYARPDGDVATDFMELARLGPEDPPGSLSAWRGRDRQVYVFGYDAGRAGVWESRGFDVERGLLREVYALELTLLSDLSTPYELTLTMASGNRLAILWQLAAD